MIWERIQANWAQYKPALREQWDRLGNDEVESVDGRRERLIALLMQHYGLTADQAEHNLHRWERHITGNWFERSV